ncbi:DUF2249 domain-containing protein [Aliirhizobium smilacinae]|uniref:DUF2249 domain-containing protein n=1 Tax=Aliirhizobium smilacinae TaxID=1395944 RepID=A0A5C4XE68_9HYPH|nr:DUF2249 domain-containing protein [Rhizobium smilacinae]TNM61803.1 DUF2249 domain-containing protein [Rhizobium smilacinae]
MSQVYKQLDIRPILREGGEPFKDIMATVQSLAPGEGLRLLSTFKPTPLLSLMSRQGFSSEMQEFENGDWEITFSPSADQAARVAVSSGAENASDWPEPLWQLDLVDAPPPMPMEKVLSRLSLMEPGEVLFVLLASEPAFLAAELESRGHLWVGASDGSGKVYRMLIRAGLTD